METDAELDRIERHIAECGGAARVRSTDRRTKRALARGVACRRLLRVRNGWYSLPGADPAAVAAVRVGGVRTSTSATRAGGLWTWDDGKLHVAVPLHASRLRLPRAASLCVHWCAELVTGANALPLAVVLLHVAMCQLFENAVAVIDSALNKRLISMRSLETAFAGAPERCRRLLAWCDAASQSGTESLVRVRLRRLGIAVRTQVPIPGVGFVDLLVGNRLVIECDSREFHDKADSYAKDRERDLELIRQGYLPLRLTYGQILFRWHEVEPVILEIVRADRHR
ncbi:endonuclease domain-containing protein [Gryllotalpicola ginsengisoli]|uniref:endonuclease domain-containing protein n=1 Tax=Gryllotalpicola ginsengisoli TaxID=444608 RepID=UPI0004043DB1|nr:DUF559 domain-containing protein [Gryllotalpicola ginsengisoli]